MNGWWFAVACLGLYLLLWAYMAWDRKRQVTALAARRHNPTQAEFMELLAGDCEADVAAFLWDKLADSWQPEATPHPDDDYLKDVPIDPEEQGDWLDAFCTVHCLSADDWPEWPAEEATTVRNFARWLSEGRRLLARVAA